MADVRIVSAMVFGVLCKKKKKGETKGKGSLETGLATKKMGKRCIKTVDGGVEARG